MSSSLPSGLPAGLVIGAWLIVAAASHASSLQSEEQVVFYPTLAWRGPDGWEAEVHGCTFEIKNRAVLAPVLRRALGIDEDELSAAEKTIFKERARLFLADHPHGRTVAIRLGGATTTLGPSAGNGHFSQRLRFPEDSGGARSAMGSLLRFETTADSGRSLRTSGEIHLLSDTGLSIISDIDDTIKVSEVRDRHELLRNTFCRPFQAVPGMAAVYQSWVRTQGTQFHYVSASPWQLYPPLAEFIGSYGFPAGTFHMKNFRVKDETFFDLFKSPEEFKRGEIEPILARFPRRSFVLVGDAGEKDPEIYGALARKYPTQIIRILIRDTTGEAPTGLRYQKTFRGLPREVWQVFKEPTEVVKAVR